MTIRIRLTLLFVVLVGSILLLFSLSVFHLYSRYREQEFRKQLRADVHTVMRLMPDADGFSPQSMSRLLQTDSVRFIQNRLVVYGPDNRVIYQFTGSGFKGENDLFFSANVLERIRLGEDIYRRTDNTTLIGSLCATCQNPKLVLTLSSTDHYGQATMLRLRQILLSGWLISLLIVGLAGWLFSGDALRPIAGIIDQVKAISPNNFHARLMVGRQKDELSGLAVTFNRMLERLEKAFVSQKNFVAQASHELRTPLTVMTGQLEVALMRSRTPDEYRMALEGTLHEVHKMNRLVNGLLDLANANTEASRLIFTPVRADELLWQARTNLVRSNPHWQIDIQFDNLPEQEEHLIVSAVEALLLTALQNLMKCGCQHADGQPLIVSLASQADVLTIQFIVRRLVLPPHELSRFLEPFYRPDFTGTDVVDCSLGLALVKRVVELHNGTIDVSSGAGPGTVFQIKLPVQPVAAPPAQVALSI